MISFVRCATALALILIAPLALASDFPTKPIRIIVPYSPGGATDSISRIIGEKLFKRLGQPVVVENKPGASEQIGSIALTQAPPDGHTLMMATTIGLSMVPSLYKKLQYDPKEFTPVVAVVKIPSVVVVNPKLPVNKLDELAAYMKSHELSYGSAGAGATTHLAMELYKRAAGVDAVHVPYKGGAPALQDLMAGNVQVMIAIAAEAMPLVRAGKLKALAITSPTRSQRYPELPPVSDVPGMKGFEVYLWYAVVAPKGTPKDVVEKLNLAINAVLGEKEIKDRLTELDIEPEGGSAAQLGEIVSAESAKWKKVIDDAGIKLE